MALTAFRLPARSDDMPFLSLATTLVAIDMHNRLGFRAPVNWRSRYRPKPVPFPAPVETAVSRGFDHRPIQNLQSVVAVHLGTAPRRPDYGPRPLSHSIRCQRRL